MKSPCRGRAQPWSCSNEGNDLLGSSRSVSQDKSGRGAWVRWHPKGQFAGKAVMKIAVPKALWSAVAAATAFLPPLLAPMPYAPKAEGGSCCYRTPRRSAHFHRRWRAPGRMNVGAVGQGDE